MYEQREKPKEKIKANNRPANLTNKTHKLSRIGDDFSAQQPNGLLQRQLRGRVNPMVADYFQPQSSTIQRMAVGLPAAQMLALASRLVASLAGGMTLSKSLQALNKSPEFERMTGVQKMMVYAVLYKVANKAKPNKTETLPTEFDAHSTTGGSEITEQGVTTTSQPLIDQAILDLLGPIPASDDMALVGNTPLPIVDDLGLGRVSSQELRKESVLKAESKALDGSTDTVVGSGGKATGVNTATTQTEYVVPDNPVSIGAGSATHKAQRWQEYQGRGGSWDYERWSKSYENNMVRATNSHKAVDDYHLTLGWGEREVTLNVNVNGTGVVRRLDIADVDSLRGIEYKTGYQSADKANLWEVQRDQVLVQKYQWDIEWVFKDRASEPLLKALQDAGIKYKVGH